MTGFWTPDAALSSPNSGVLIPGGFDEQALLGDGAFALKVPALPWDRRLVKPPHGHRSRPFRRRDFCQKNPGLKSNP
jgi:hypothetical protein